MVNNLKNSLSPSRLRLQRHDCVDMGHVLLAFQHFHPMSCTLGEGNAHTPTRKVRDAKKKTLVTQ